MEGVYQAEALDGFCEFYFIWGDNQYHVGTDDQQIIMSQLTTPENENFEETDITVYTYMNDAVGLDNGPGSRTVTYEVTRLYDNDFNGYINCTMYYDTESG